MKIYRFKHSSENDIGGNYPQSQTSKLPKGKSIKDDDYVWNVHHLKVPLFKPFFGVVELIKEAKITDLISSATISNGYIVSPKLMEIFQSVSCGTHVSYPITIRHKKKKFDYFWIHFVDSFDELIDLYQTEFLIKNDFEEGVNVSFDSFSELENKWKDLDHFQRLKTTNLTLVKAVPIDCFYFKFLSYDLIISELLKTKLLENDISGIKLYEKEIKINY